MEWLNNILQYFSIHPETLMLFLPILIVVFLFLLVTSWRSLMGIKSFGVGKLSRLSLRRPDLSAAFATEKELAQNYHHFRDIKHRLKDRYNAVMANHQVVQELEKALLQLRQAPQQNEIEIQLFEKEIQERKVLTQNLLTHHTFLENSVSPTPTPSPRKALDTYIVSDDNAVIAAAAHAETDSTAIQINGFHLLDG